MLYPLTFHPIFKERVWGGRKLEQLYHKMLPPAVPIGESWEISDRPGDASVIANGPLAGKNLRWLMEKHGEDLLGTTARQDGRFPLLIKILDAREKLSLQVHPPSVLASQLGGEPKTEFWYVAAAEPGAELYAGLKRDVTRGQFERGIQTGTVAEQFHRLSVQAGDAMFLPSGRVHALGAGLVIFEVQQNSDTTYRVFDWNRVGLDGRPRPLHIQQSLASIDFDDFEPSRLGLESERKGDFEVRPLVNDPIFRVDAYRSKQKGSELFSEPKMRIFGFVEGRGKITDPKNSVSVELTNGQFCLIPASVRGSEVSTEPKSSFLLVQSA